MGDISSIVLPSGASYDFKDTASRSSIERLEEAILYDPLKILNLQVSPSVVEKGHSVSEYTISYSFNKVPTSFLIDGSSFPPAVSGEKTFNPSSSILQTTSFAISATDSGSDPCPPTTVSSEVTMFFVNRIYYGVDSVPASITSSFVKGLSNSALSENKKQSFEVSAGSNEYVWYAYPVRLGLCKFVIDGITGGFNSPDTISVTNSSNYTEDYYVYRSTNHSLGDLEIIIK